jgi:hypothetical protein
MDIIAIPPMTPPAMAPAWPPEECEGVEDGVEDALAEAEDVYTPEAPKFAPGPYSGLSIKRG